jgi:hypothetical protein
LNFHALPQAFTARCPPANQQNHLLDYFKFALYKDFYGFD